MEFPFVLTSVNLGGKEMKQCGRQGQMDTLSDDWTKPVVFVLSKSFYGVENELCNVPDKLTAS